MTQTREPLSIMDGGPPSITFSTKTKKGHHVTKNLALTLFTIYIISIVATGFLVYNFAACRQIDIPSSLHVSRYVCNETYDSTTFRNPTTSKDDTKTSVKPSTETKPKVDVRLPRSLKPLKYNIKLTPFIYEGNFTFNGDVSLVMEVLQDTNNITLHAAELNILSSEVTELNSALANNGKIDIVGHANDTEKEFYVIKLKEYLKKGMKYMLHMKYTGCLNDDLHGFYRSFYKVGTTKRWLVTTQFQPTDARRAFPCFDEPALKAKFTISIAHPRNMSAISNMNSVGQTEIVEGLPDYIWDHFAESVPMSTYLVAFIVSDFAHKSDGNFTVWARETALATAEYALDIGPKILKYFSEFYQISYPLPKMDLVALPDFNAGAMENWGLVTFRETAMLYDENISPKINKPRVATVVAHELAHQWFGNLVTPSWWSDLWLNEGFASYLEYVGIDAIEKSWKAMDQFVIHEVQNVFGLDALASSHQISVEVGNPDEINEIFDRISYGKGAAIIRMMNHFLTDEVFTKGITTYLESRKFDSAEQNDLWEALTVQARKDGVFDNSMSVKVIMDTWTLQTGFPVVNVKRDYVTGDITLNQERFLLAKNETAVMKATRSRDQQLWWIPITYTTRGSLNFTSTKPARWMKGQKTLQIFDKEAALNNDWIIFNIRQAGFYRVNYDERNWRLIISFLNDANSFEEIPPANRAQILDDALNLALGGRLDYSTALDATKYLKQEREYVPWKAGLVGLGYLDGMLAKGSHYYEYKKYLLDLIEDVYNDVGFADSPDDSMLTIYKRIDIINIACLMDHDDCVTQAVTQFHNWMMTPNPDVHNPISPNVRSTVYCTSVRVGGAAQWNFARERFARSQTGSERELLLTALGCTRLPWLLYRYMDQSCRNDSGIRKQDVYRVFGAVSNSVIGQPIAFAWIRENWTKLKNYLGPSSSNLNTIVKYSTRKLNKQHELDELIKFAKDHKGELGRTIDQAVEKTEANVLWMNRNYDKIVEWLKNVTLSS